MLRKTAWGTLVALALTTGSMAAPIDISIDGHDINVGAYNGAAGPSEYAMSGLAPDKLVFTEDAAHREATAYWPSWPMPPVSPIWTDSEFGGDFYLNVEFDDQDAPYVGAAGAFDVSLVGAGADPNGADLKIYGSLDTPGPAVLLWAIELEEVALYGVSGTGSYKLDGVGAIVGGLIADTHGLVGQVGVMRGDLDFFGAPAGWIPSEYNPARIDDQQNFRAAYSGETGVLPEPASLVLLALGACVAMRRL